MSSSEVERLNQVISDLKKRLNEYVPKKVFEDVLRERGEFWERCKKAESVVRLVKLRGYKSCIQCKHFSYDAGWAGTDVTPGDPPRIGCGKGYWEYRAYDDELEAYRQKLDTAAGCEDFKEACK